MRTSIIYLDFLGVDRTGFRSYVVLIALFLSIAHLSAQKNTLRVGLGFSRIDRQDQIFSPLVHSGGSVQQIDLHWQRTGRLLQFAGISYGGFAASRFASFDYTQKPDTDIKTTLPHTFNMVELTYGLGKQWQSGAFTLSAGGALENTVQAMYYQYGQAAFLGYFAAFSVSPWLNVSLPAGNAGAVQAGLSVPLVSWIARSPYLVNDDEFIENISAHGGVAIFGNFIEDGSLQFPDKMQKVTAQLSFTRALGKKWTAGVRYRCQFIRQTDPLTLLSYQNDFRLEIGRKF